MKDWLKMKQSEPGRNYRPIHQLNDFIERHPEPQKSRAPKYIQLGDLPASQSDRLPVSQGVELHLLCGPATPDIPQKGQLVNSKPRGTEIKPNERVKCR